MLLTPCFVECSNFAHQFGEFFIYSRYKFLILKQTVTTSARKLRTYSLKEVLSLTTGILRHGTKAVKQREGMEFWYAERRKDPYDLP